MFKFILKSNFYIIHCNTFRLQKINPYIYSKLIQTQQYEVISNVSDNAFQSFIDYIINDIIPNIDPNNFFDYQLLSKEFGCMQEIIQLFQKHQYFSLILKKQENVKKLKLANDSLQQQIEKYKKIFHILFNENYIENNYEFSENKNKLLMACKSLNVNLIYIMTRKKTIHKNGLIFTLNEKEKTAGVFSNLSQEYEVFIPKSIRYKNIKFLVTNIHENCFKSSHIKSVYFAENSKLQIIERKAFCKSSIEYISIPPSVTQIGKKAFSGCRFLKTVKISSDSKLHTICEYAFANSPIENISIPSNIDNLKEGWLAGTPRNMFVKIIPNNKKNILYYDNSFIIGKSDPKNKKFDVILFVRRNIKTVKIPPFIKIIAPYAFYKCFKIRKIIFTGDNSLSTIGKYAFAYSTLEKINIPSKIREIDEYAFGYCKNLDSVVFSSDIILSFVGKNIFYGSAIKNIIIPSNFIQTFNREWFTLGRTSIKIIIKPGKISNIEYYEDSLILGKTKNNFIPLKKTNIYSDMHDYLLFMRRNIETVIIPSFVKRIGPYAFNNCPKLKRIIFLPNSMLEFIEKGAFSESKLERIDLPLLVKEIKEYAFNKCSQLKQINFHKNSKLEIIGHNSFVSTSIESITIPVNVRKIGYFSFYNCKKLKNINFSENSKLSIIECRAFCSTSIETIIIPSNVSYIGNSIFEYCEKLKRIEFSQNSKLKTICQMNFRMMNIESLSIPSSVVEYQKNFYIDGYVQNISIQQNQIVNLYIYNDNFLIGKSNINNNNFDILIYIKDKNKSELTIPSFIKKVNQYALQYSNFQKVYFHDDSELEEISNNAFQNSKIKSINIPKKVKIIESHAFECCMKLEKIDFSNNENVRKIKNYAFYNTGIKEIVLPFKLEEIGSHAFKSSYYLKKVTFLDHSQLKLIDDEAFCSTALESISIPSNVIRIGKMAFSCNNLKKVSFENDSKLEIIEDEAFRNSKIEYISIPSTVKRIGFSAFDNCENLKIIEILENSQLKFINKNIFGKCTNAAIMIPCNIKKIIISD